MHKFFLKSQTKYTNKKQGFFLKIMLDTNHKKLILKCLEIKYNIP